MTVVAAALLDDDGRILLQQRAPGRAMAGLWEFPGGKVEEGELPEAALARELEEGLGRLRMLSMAVALCFLFLVVTALVTILRDPYQMDFISYWAAGRLGLHGQTPLAYDVVAHHRIELEATAVGQIPFGYPPAFLLLASPFALLPYPGAAVTWVILTWAAYAAAVRLWAPKAFWPAMAMPPVLINAITGQAGFLIAALFIAGMALLPKRPPLGGLLLGLIVVKPPLGIVLPFALAAGREWRA